MKNKDIVQFHLRIPKQLKKKVEKLAKEEDRSLNKQIVRVLEDYARSFEAKSQTA